MTHQNQDRREAGALASNSRLDEILVVEGLVGIPKPSCCAASDQPVCLIRPALRTSLGVWRQLSASSEGIRLSPENPRSEVKGQHPNHPIPGHIPSPPLNQHPSGCNRG